MDNTLDQHLATKDLKELFSDIRRAGYHNSFKHQKGYIVVKKTSFVKVRIAFDQYGHPQVSTMLPGIADILFSIFLLLFCALLGGIVLVGVVGYFFVRLITYVLSLSKTREFKAEIEAVIR